MTVEEAIKQVTMCMTNCSKKECKHYYDNCVETEKRAISKIIEEYKIQKESADYMYEQYQDIGKLHFELVEKYEKLEKEVERLKRLIKLKDEYCDVIYGIGFDYDGCASVEQLKDLIDEMCNLAVRAINNDDETQTYISKWHFDENHEMVVDRGLNILLEELPKKKTNTDTIDTLKQDFLKLEERNNDLERALFDDDYRKFIQEKKLRGEF